MATSIHLDYVLGTLPLEERFPAARRLGFDAVEYPFPYAIPAHRYAQLLADHGLEQISIGAPASDYRHGEPGYSLTPARQRDFDRSIETAIEYAQAIKCRNVHVFSGPRAVDVSPELALATYCDNLRNAFGRLQRVGLRPVVETLNSRDFPGYFIERLDQLARVIERIACPGIGVILDVYHAYVNREDPVAFLRRHPDTVAHIQLADFPGRHEPGTGSIDFDELFETLQDVGYAGSIGLEYVPTRSVFDGVPLASRLFGHVPQRRRTS